MTNFFNRFPTYGRFVANIVRSFTLEPRESLRMLRALPAMVNGSFCARNWPGPIIQQSASNPESVDLPRNGVNPLRRYFDLHKEGRGILKWNHYFEIYHKHFERFVGKSVNVLEIGVFGGGSLDMWKRYFGSGCRLYGVD